MSTCITKAKNLKGKVVLVRASLNVPMNENGTVADEFRISKTLPTLSFLQEQEAIIVIISHIGREADKTLEGVSVHLQKRLPHKFIKNFFADEKINENIDALKEKLKKAKEGSVFLLDNLRATAKEMENDQALAKKLAKLAPIYVNESFSVSHREHMSIVSLPVYTKEKYHGITFDEELAYLSKALNANENDIAIIGGNKFATKLPLVERFLENYGTVVVGGALANTLYKLQDHEIGDSVYEEPNPDITARLLKIIDSEKLFLPSLVVIKNKEGNVCVKHISEVTKREKIYDIAPESFTGFEHKVTQAQTIVWNGPMGYYEGGFTAGTRELLEIITSGSAKTILGGGNTIDAARDLGFEKKVSFLSTAGGAMVQYLTEKTLPGIKVLED